MASSFAAQLRSIAQNTTHELDLRARRNAHSESLLFPKDVAAKQDFGTIHVICVEGFRELCSLDAAFLEFERNLFSAQSIRTEREQMTKKDNESLDKVLERCLTMLSGKVLLKPGVRCLEWLVRRFQVHIYNTSSLLLAVLPWHEMSIWRSVLSIVAKERCTSEWKFLGMYKEEALNVPRRAVVYAMANNDGFFSLMNRYVVQSASDGISGAALLKFWNGIFIEAVITRLDAARSGRKEVQRQRIEDVLLKVLPILSEGLEVRDCSDLTIACFTLAAILASKANLEDHVLDSLLQAIAAAARHCAVEDQPVIITITAIVSQKMTKSVPKGCLEYLMNLSKLDSILADISNTYQIEGLVEAMINGALSGAKKKTAARRLAFVEMLLQLSQKLTQQVANHVVQVILERIIKSPYQSEPEILIRDGLLDLLRRFSENQSISLAISEASKVLHQDLSQIETMLGSTMGFLDAETNTETKAIAVAIHPLSSSTVELLEKLPSRTVDTTSFLGKHNDHLYSQLRECFVLCCKSDANLERFQSLPLWRSVSSDDVLFISFFLRTAMDSATSGQKCTALQCVTQYLRSLNESIDTQVFLPYVLTALSDATGIVRKSATEVLTAMAAFASVEDDSARQSGLAQIYDESSMATVKWMTMNHFNKVITQALLPALEECVLDRHQIAKLVSLAIQGSEATSQSSVKTKFPELKKSLRIGFLEFLASHAIATPLWRVKVSIVDLLAKVNRLGTSSKGQLLSSLLSIWSSYDEEKAKRIAESEQIELSAIDATMLSIISAQDKEAVSNALAMVENKITVRRDALISAFFHRIEDLWVELKYDAQISCAQKMFEMVFSEIPTLAKGAQGLLRSVSLPTGVIGVLLEQSAEGLSQIQDGQQQPKKRRRTSHGRDSLPPNLSQIVNVTSARLTFALELADDSKPEVRPELLPVLFDILAILRRLKQEHKLNVPYLHDLCLGIMLAIVESQRLMSKPTIDTSAIRADLITDSIVSSDSPQVQNTALLLCASLTPIAPDRILHNIMPLFTFMGQNVFSRDDEHSIHIVNQAIDNIVPVLVRSLRNQNMDLVKSTSSLLASFAAAYDHIPQHRRVALYARFLTRMGPSEFSFLLFAMMAQRYASHSSFNSFFDELMAEFDPITHLSTFQKIIQLASDVLSANPQLSDDLFGGLEPPQQQVLAKAIFKIAIRILTSKELKGQTTRLNKTNSDVKEGLRTELHNSIRLILSTIQDFKASNSSNLEEAKQCLDALLDLPPLLELFTILQTAIFNQDFTKTLKPQALRVLASQLQRNPMKDSMTRMAALEFLTSLTGMLETEQDAIMKQSIIVCLDRISEIYGRKDLESVISAANAVASNSCLGSDDHRTKIMSLLCLASMLEVLKENCIPLIPDIMPKITMILRDTVQVGHEDEELHIATLTLITAVISHVPFLISGEDLQAILLSSSLSSFRYESETATGSRIEMLSTIARKVELELVLTSLLGEDLNASREEPGTAELEKLEMLSTALQTAPKSDVVKCANNTSGVLLAHLDQRARILNAGDAANDRMIDAVKQVEEKTKQVAMQLVYKLNDATFRPVFEGWVDWASNAYDIEALATREVMKPLRRISMLGLLTHFFDTLKSIVTSYASYIIPLAQEILTQVASDAASKQPNRSPINTNLNIPLLSMMRATFNHDADAFYSTPSHFEPIAAPLVSQLQLASTKSLRPLVYEQVIPTIIALALATLDTPSHHQAISHSLVQLRHSSSAAVRLASIKTFAALTADDAVSEDLIANIIGIGSGEGEGARGVGGAGSVGEVMIYVNEMLEDDDEDVDREVRRWVQTVREKTGEDVFV